jgi:hypothetical protein
MLKKHLESFFHVQGCYCRGFLKEKIVLSRELLSGCLGHSTGGWVTFTEVYFVADEHNCDVWLCVVSKLCDPSLYA